MSWIGPVVKGGVKYGVKYGPQAKVLWDKGGKQLQEAARAKAETVAARRTAFGKAETVVDGSVLKQVDAATGTTIWVVFSGDRPVAAYPVPSVDLTALVEHADLSTRVTPEEHRAQQLRERARQARRRVSRQRELGSSDS